MNENILLDEGMSAPKSATLANAKEIVRLRESYTELHKKIRNGKWALAIFTILSTIGAVVEITRFLDDKMILAIDGAYITILIVCCVLMFRKPFLGFSIALAIIAVITILIVIGDPIQIFSGILWKGIAVYYMIVAMNVCKEYIDTLKNLKVHNIEVEGMELIK